MRTVRTLAAVVCVLACAACQGARIPVGSGAAERVVEPGVVSVYTWRAEGGGTSRMQGTGFLLAPDVVVTNYHVLEQAARATVRFPAGADRPVVAVLGDDPDSDLVLLRLPGPATAAPLALAPAVPAPGTAVRAVGSAGGEAQTVVETHVGSRLVTFDVLDEAVMLRASIRPGMSGAPVLDDAGRVVGVLSRGTNVERQSYMVPARRVAQVERFDRPLAVDAWNRWRRRDPKSTGRALFGEAATAYEQGRYARSIQLLEQALDAGLSPAAEATAWYVVGDALGNLGRRAEATRAYQRAVQTKPRHALSHAALGAAYRWQGRTASAVQAYTTALGLVPESGAFHVGLGWTHVHARRWRAAYSAFRRALQIEAEDASAWTGVAAACLELGRTAQARDYARRAGTLRPDVAESYWVLGTAHTRLGEWDAAVAALERGLALEPGYAPAMFELGRVHLMRGERAKASEQHRRLRTRAPRLADRLGRLMDEA